LIRVADYEADRYLVVQKGRERLAVSVQAAQKFEMERFNLRKLSNLEVGKQYQIKISKRFAALENLNDSENINRAGKTLKGLSKLQPKRI